MLVQNDPTVVLVAVVALVAAVVFTAGDDAGTTDAEAWDLPALDEGLDPGDGGRFTLASYEGTPLVVKFFASWCVSCENELPRFRDYELRVDCYTVPGFAGFEATRRRLLRGADGVIFLPWKLIEFAAEITHSKARKMP